MTEVNNSGYETVRALINSSLTVPSQWDYIELQDDTDSVVTRVSITGDSRFSWTTGATDQTQTVTGTVTGGDADITTTVTITQSVLKNADSDTADELHSETMADATLASDSDSVDISHNVEVPQV